MAAGRIVTPAYMPALDSDGEPISGALLYTYYNNTTTPRATYTDASLTVPHENPVVADASGVFPSIFADSAVQYSVTITDASDAPLAAYDNVKASAVLATDEAALKTANLSDLANVGSAREVLGWYASRAAAVAASVSVNVSSLELAGYSAAGDGGRALYKRAASEPSHACKFQSADGAWWELAESRASPKMVGAVGDGSTNDRAAVVALLGHAGVSVIDARDGQYAISSQIDVSRRLTVLGRFKLAAAFSGGAQKCLFYGTADGGSWDIEIDFNSQGWSGLYLAGSHNVAKVYGHTLTGQVSATGGNQSVVYDVGDFNETRVHGKDITKGTSDNDSLPRLITTDTGSQGAYIASCTGYNVNLGWCDNGTRNRCDLLKIEGLLDNGIYALSGSVGSSCGTLIIDNSTGGGGNSAEPFAVISTKFSIDEVVIRDVTGTSSVSDATLHVGRYDVRCTSASFLYVPLSARSSNTTSTVKIDELRGEFYMCAAATGAGILQLSAGGTEYALGEVDLVLHYVSGSTTTLVTHSAGNFARVADLILEIVDDTGALTSGTNFLWNISTISEQSFVGRRCVVRASPTNVRFVNPAQGLIAWPAGTEIVATAGPYVLATDAANPTPRIFYGSAAPTLGTWLDGDIIFNKFPAAGGSVGWVCTTPGTPGTWKTFGTIAA